MWLAVLFVGIGVADLAHAAFAQPQDSHDWARRWWFTALFGVTAQCSLALLTLSTGADAVATVLCVITVFAWRRVHDGELVTPLAAARALAVGTVPAVGLVAASGLTGPVGGPLPGWLATVHLLGLDHAPAQRTLLLGAVLLLNLATGNVVVRDVLVIAGRPSLDHDDTTPTLEPANVWAITAETELTAPTGEDAASDPEPDPLNDPEYDPLASFEASTPGDAEPDAPAQPLRGGRILGPMERLLIIGLGSWGNLTAAAIVVAAKGLLRFPELNQASKARGGRSLDEITEYVLIGTLASILFALGTLALAS